MEESIKKVLFIASVALNLVFTATYVTCKLPLLAGGHQPSTQKGPLFLQLDLTPHQVKQFSVERDRFHARLQELGQQVKIKQVELIDVLAATPSDQAAVKRKQNEIQRLQAVVQDGVVDHLLEASSFLTPEQRVRFFDLIKARIETGAQACPPSGVGEWVNR